jgi:4-amino-4-deoxy-L-arabinose transferase-like glycosyltransferase
MTLTGTSPPACALSTGGPAVESARPRAGRVGGRSRAGLAVAALALAAAVWAVAASALFLPRLTDNGDEAVYLLQAESLRSGHLFPPAPEPAGAFLPWLSRPAGDHYVTKYTPVFPGFIALSHRVFGSDRAALALAAAGAVVACYCLAREVLGRRWDAIVAAAFLAGSPLFAIQSATYLSYLFNAALLMGSAAALLAGVRRRARGSLALAGLLLGLAVFARPFDAALFAGPLLAWWAWSGRHRAPQLAGEAAWIAAGALPPLGAMAVYFRVATGSFLRPPFTFVGSSDTLGFGPKRMYAGMPFLDYTPGRALVAFGRLTILTGFWGFGGLLLIGLTVIGHRSLRGRASRWLALVAVTVPVGYLFFWGSFSSSEWGGPWRFGPFYWLPVLVPASILGAAGFARLWRWDRLVARLVAGGMAAVSLFVVVQALAEHKRYGAVRDQLYAAPLAAAAELDRAVVFLPPLDGPYLLQPFSLARNATFDGPVVWALDRGPRKNLDVIQRLPGRTPYRVLLGASDRSPSRLQRLTVVNGRLVPDSVSQ